MAGGGLRPRPAMAPWRPASKAFDAWAPAGEVARDRRRIPRPAARPGDRRVVRPVRRHRLGRERHARQRPPVPRGRRLRRPDRGHRRHRPARLFERISDPSARRAPTIRCTPCCTTAQRLADLGRVPPDDGGLAPDPRQRLRPHRRRASAARRRWSRPPVRDAAVPHPDGVAYRWSPPDGGAARRPCCSTRCCTCATARPSAATWLASPRSSATARTSAWPWPAAST
jgi:hypothetical protein